MRSAAAVRRSGWNWPPRLRSLTCNGDGMRAGLPREGFLAQVREAVVRLGRTVGGYVRHGVLLAGRYELERQIGAGGAGEVWRAADTELGRAVAVKLLRPEYAADDEALARFRAGARHATQLVYPGIVQVYDHGLTGRPGVPYLVMELVDGPSLAGVMAAGPLESTRVLDLVRQVAAALAEAHAAGLVHGDIKPANLLRDADGTVKIADFGIAYAAGSAALTGTGTLPGTPGYLAPERAAGGPASAASDLYSLGIVAWECLAGAPPFTGTPLHIAFAHAQRPLPPLPVGVPAGIAALVAELTARDPAARPPSAAAAAARAAQLLEGMTADATSWSADPLGGRHALLPLTLTLAPVTVHDQPSARRRTERLRRWAIMAAGCAAGAAALGGWLAFAPSGATSQPHGAGIRSAPGTRAAGTRARAHSPSAARTVLVDAAALDGQPASVVLSQLRQIGLQPRSASVADGRVKPGTALAVQPAGRVPTGATVVVTVAVAPSGHHRR